jgi:hypothetical protein
MSEVQIRRNLTKGNRSTLERLDKQDYGMIKQADVTRLLARMLDSKETATEVLPKVFEYEKTKFPDKNSSDIEKYLFKKIKAKDDKAMFTEVISSGDFSSFPSTDKPKAPAPTFSEPVPVIAGKKKNKGDMTSTKLNEILDGILSDKKTKVDTTTSTASTLRERASTAVSTGVTSITEYIDTGSTVYKNNKTAIDKITGSFTQKSIDDGSWLTKIASLEAPQIELLQSVVNFTGLGFSKSDKSNFEKILSKDRSVSGEVPVGEQYKLILKSLINPDQVGNLISRRVGETKDKLVDGFSDFYDKLTGKKKEEDKSDLIGLIEGRRDKTAMDEKRKNELNVLLGKGGGGVDGGRIDWGGIRTFDPTKPRPPDNREEDAYSILKPPPVPGFQGSTTASEDVMGFLRGLLPVPKVSQTKATYLDTLKRDSPALYKQYEDKLGDYNYKIRKLAYTQDSNIDENDFALIKDMSGVTKSLLKTASSMKDLLSDEDITELFDVSSTIEDLSNGKFKDVSYSDYYKVLQEFMNKLPAEVLRDAKGEVVPILKTVLDAEKNKLGTQFAGDSDLSNNLTIKTAASDEAKVDLPENTIDDDGMGDTKKLPEKPEDPEEPEDPKKPEDREGKLIKESPLDNNETTEFARLRPRLAYGNTDDLFFRKKDEVQQANLLHEVMNVARPPVENGSTNELYKRNLYHDQMRYGRCYALPRLAPPNPTMLPQQFVNLQAPIFTSQYPPTMVGFESMRDPHLFGQFYNFQPREVETTYPAVEMKTHPNEYPHMANLDTGGETQEYSVPKNMRDYLRNAAWTRR